ncbi:MAG: hypothetical protein KJZ83_06765 [Burkholderiaceae bacterium]|nr:hypothetical protein [Burkholderiaceae bacterium]
MVIPLGKLFWQAGLDVIFERASWNPSPGYSGGVCNESTLARVRPDHGASAVDGVSPLRGTPLHSPYELLQTISSTMFETAPVEQLPAGAPRQSDEGDDPEPRQLDLP